MKQIEVQIMGQSYLLGCPEGGEAHLLDAVERVDTAMCKIRESGKVKARDRIAVLAALNLAFDLSEPGSSRPAPAVGSAAKSARTSMTPGASPSMQALLERLDAVLGEDGQLI
jgi:cell division protein ZapA